MNEIETKMNDNQTQPRSTARASSLDPKQGLPYPELSLRVSRDEAEIYALNTALHKTGWNRKRAAKLLSISYRGLLYKIRRHNIVPPQAERS
jgi:transcriptional regulator with GAF, ATPase, and Fis domain